MKPRKACHFFPSNEHIQFAKEMGLVFIISLASVTLAIAAFFIQLWSF